jgi:hypothetical protein
VGSLLLLFALYLVHPLLLLQTKNLVTADDLCCEEIMFQIVNLSTWKVQGDAEVQRVDEGWVIRLVSRSGDKTARVLFALPETVQHTLIRVHIKCRLLDPWNEQLVVGISDTIGETVVFRRLTVDTALSRLVVDKLCGETPMLSFAVSGSCTSLSLFLAEVSIEERILRVAASEVLSDCNKRMKPTALPV